MVSTRSGTISTTFGKLTSQKGGRWHPTLRRVAGGHPYFSKAVAINNIKQSQTLPRPFKTTAFSDVKESFSKKTGPQHRNIAKLV